MTDLFKINFKNKMLLKYKIKLKSLIGQRFHLQKLGKWEQIQTS